MRLIACCIALGIAIATAPARAQEQKTLGPCSPAIAGVNGNVNVTCISRNQRIRIARFIGEAADEQGKPLLYFISENIGQIVHLDVDLDAGTDDVATDEDVQYVDTSKWLDENSHSLYFKYPVPTYLEFKDIDKVDGYVYRDTSGWHFRGYYLLCGVFYYNYTYNFTTYCLRAIDDKEILMSDKYDTR